MKRRVTMVWLDMSPGFDQIGRRVELNGRRGIVVGGTELCVEIELEPLWLHWLRKVFFK